MPTDVDAQLDSLRAELIKDQNALDQFQEKVNSNYGQTLDLGGEPDSAEDTDNVRWPHDPLEVTQREYGLIRNCMVYRNSAPAGLPGHNLMLLLAKMAEHLENLYGISPNDGPYVILLNKPTSEYGG